MKKVSVFTVLTCFLAGAAHFPCYAGTLFSTPEKKDDEPSLSGGRGRGRGLPPSSLSGGRGRGGGLPPSSLSGGGRGGGLPPSSLSGGGRGLTDSSMQSVGRGAGRGIVPAVTYSKPTPSPSFPSLDHVVIGSGDLDPDLLRETPTTFAPPSDLKGESTETDPKVLQQIADRVRGALGENAQNVIVSVYLPPLSLGQHPSSLPPSVSPAPISLSEKVLEDSDKIPSSDKSFLPAQGSSQIPSMYPTPYPPHGDQQPTLPILSYSTDHEEVSEVTQPVSGWALILPKTLKPIPIPGSRGQLVRLPKVLDLCIYRALSDVTHPDFKVINSQQQLPDSKKSMAFNLINTYLESYGKKFGQDVTAIANCLRQAIESSDGRPVSFKVCQRKEIRTALFMFHVEGGAVIIGKVPGQDF